MVIWADPPSASNILRLPHRFLMTAVNKERGKYLTHRCILNLSPHPCHQGSAARLYKSVSIGRGLEYVFSIGIPDPIFTHRQVWEAPNHPLRQILLLTHFVTTKQTWVKRFVHDHTACKEHSGLPPRPRVQHLGTHPLGYHPHPRPRAWRPSCPTRAEASGPGRP